MLPPRIRNLPRLCVNKTQYFEMLGKSGHYDNGWDGPSRRWPCFPGSIRTGTSAKIQRKNRLGKSTLKRGFLEANDIAPRILANTL